MVGTGWWATFNHIPVAQADGRAEIVAIADLDEGRRRQVATTFGIPNHYASVGDMVSKHELDGIIIATPHSAHTVVALPALAAGAHVLIEKPMATTAADARAIVAAAAKAGKQVLIPCGYNFTDYTATAARVVEEGRIGEVKHIVCQMSSALEDLFAGQPMLETAEHMYRPPASTWADPKKAGGYGWGQLSHPLAWVFRVAGVKPQSAFCMTGKSPAGVDYYDAAAVRFTNGATMSLSGSASLPKHSSVQFDIRIFGSEGMLLLDTERERLVLNRADGKDEIFPFGPGQGAYNGKTPVNSFIDICIGGSAPNEADGVNGQYVTETLDAMYRSAASGKLETI